MQTNNILLLEETVIYVYDSELENDVELLSSLTGATIVDQLVPFLTTHVICLKETPQLRAGLARMFSQNKAGANSNKAAITTDSNLVEIVTIDWLKSCLLQQKVCSTLDYKPEIVKIHSETSKRLAATYQVKKNLFNKMTFCIIEDSFYEKDGDKKEEIIEMIKRQIIENGGLVLGED